MGLAVNCRIAENVYFDRKNYFYPDSPKAFQTTQDNAPICIEGELTIANRPIRINRIHIEEDAGKSIHDEDPKNSLIDLNRSGTPLLELVTEPDLRSSDEAVAFFTKIREIAKYIDVCDGNMQEGSMRCDANVSVRLKGAEAYGERCEIKNLNSFKFLKKAIDFEAKRQIQLIESGETVLQQTRGFNVDKATTFAQRSKEDAHDYRYFPEPDLAPISVSRDVVNALKATLPELPEQAAVRLQKDYSLSVYDAELLVSERSFLAYFEELSKLTKLPKKSSNWLLNTFKSYLNENDMEFSNNIISVEKLAELILLVEDGKVNLQNAQLVIFGELTIKKDQNALNIAKELDLLVSNDGNFVDDIIDEIITQNPTEFELYTKKGKKNLLGFFMGKLMKAAKGKVDPKSAQKLLLKKLNKN
ncbi:UNVERIFIED_CONTAM: hypothetical protein GTU68_028928 [Idotea baltica]|nr:hypothetical protein [Idotea baltica]